MGLTNKCSSVYKTDFPEGLIAENYQARIDRGELERDDEQLKVVIALQALYHELVASNAIETRSGLKGLSFIFGSNGVPDQNQIKGLYIWGGIGRGKTLLVDSFFELLPIVEKQRLHFYRFMQILHEQLDELESEADPLKIVAQRLIKQYRVLCLDEIHVNDITDAMLLGRLFDYLFSEGVVLVATSNQPPTDLYSNGLQRERFLPAIELLEQNTTVLEMGGHQDYRLNTLKQSGGFHLSSGAISEHILLNAFNGLSVTDMHLDRRDIIINKRRIAVKMWSDGVVWFDFDALCNTPRSNEDYHQIATFFHTVLISDIPIMDNSANDAARRFIGLIDTLYDAHVNIIVSAESKPEKLYTGNRLDFEFQRTVSRLLEMQSEEYMKARRHGFDQSP